MTLVSQIITDAYRENNLIPLVATPNANQIAEALRRLNAILLSTVGNEAGDGLNEYNIEGDFTDEALLTPWVPDNARLMLNNTSAKEFLLDPYPQDGQRFALVDVAGNLNTFNVVLNGNGRRIEDAATVTLSTDDLYRQWLYRSDIGNWVRVAVVVEADEMPFGVEFDDYFTTALAIRLSPRYGQIIPPETLQAFNRAKSQLRSRYRVSREVESDLSSQNWYADENLYTGYTSGNFATGRPYRWR